MTFEQRPFGVAGTLPATLYTLRSANGASASVTDFGATLTSLLLPDRAGELADVVLGFDDVAGYAAGCPFFGATIGRVANRIDRGHFRLGSRDYELATNDPPHHLHGGPLGWDKLMWRFDPAGSDAQQLTFAYHSPAGEEGYPGSVDARVTYRFSDELELRIEMTAEASELTLVNMAHHSYWNLAGHGAATALDHELRLHAASFTPGTPVVPDGRVMPVAGTPLDFTSPKRVGAQIDQLGPNPAGYDHNFVVDGTQAEFRPVAELYAPSSGRQMALWANQPGVQFYSGNFLDGVKGKSGASYGHRSGLCLETQAFPNAINVPEWRAQVLLAPGERYAHHMSHRFSVR